jgi:hypothetical protein
MNNLLREEPIASVGSLSAEPVGRLYQLGRGQSRDPSARASGLVRVSDAADCLVRTCPHTTRDKP